MAPPVRALCTSDPDDWVLPRAILPEVAYLVGRQGGVRIELGFLDDVATDRYREDGRRRSTRNSHGGAERPEDARRRSFKSVAIGGA